MFRWLKVGENFIRKRRLPKYLSKKWFLEELTCVIARQNVIRYIKKFPKKREN